MRQLRNNMNTTHNKEKWEKEFADKFHKTILHDGFMVIEDFPPHKWEVDICTIRDFIRSLAQSEYQRGKMEALLELMDKINTNHAAIPCRTCSKPGMNPFGECTCSYGLPRIDIEWVHKILKEEIEIVERYTKPIK